MIYFQFLDIRAYVIAYLIISFFGLCIGSFLNVCIYRLPRGESLVKRASHCTTCGSRIHFYDMVPVFSWLFLKGKCRKCGEPISGRYPLVESLNWILYLLVLTFIDVQFYPAQAVLTALFFSVLVVIAFIDYDTMEIHVSQLVLILIIAAASQILSYFMDFGITLSQRIIGALCISIPFFIIGEISAVYIKKKTGERYRGIELGDTFLMLCSGLVIGTKCIIVSAFAGIFIAAVIGLINKARGKDSKFAFGPYLAAGLVIGTLWGNQISDWYLSLFSYSQF
ncbi:MAG: prepilin peptidase [Oscillospiraceae bacterium]|nr:prepilin peptidase [Oscillospiraceae bacterium]